MSIDAQEYRVEDYWEARGRLDSWKARYPIKQYIEEYGYTISHDAPEFVIRNGNKELRVPHNCFMSDMMQACREAYK